MRDVLLKEFGSKIIVVERKDDRITGNFDIVILDGNLLIYSRKKKGQGMCETQEDILGVIESIRAFLQ